MAYWRSRRTGSEELLFTVLFCSQQLRSYSPLWSVVPDRANGRDNVVVVGATHHHLEPPLLPDAPKRGRVWLVCDAF